jgi:hypothetical protein
LGARFYFLYVHSMITEDAPETYGYTIFCDDIRVEVGNRLTFVGVYTAGTIIAESFPLLIPRLAMHIVYMQRRPNVTPPTKILLFLPDATDDKPSFQFEVPAAVAEQAAKANAVHGDQSFHGEDVYMSMGIQFGVLNLLISQPGPIKLRAVRGDSLVRLGGLKIVAQTPAELKA